MEDIRINPVPAVVVRDLHRAVVGPSAGIEGGGCCEADLAVLGADSGDGVEGVVDVVYEGYVWCLVGVLAPSAELTLLLDVEV